ALRPRRHFRVWIPSFQGDAAPFPPSWGAPTRGLTPLPTAEIFFMDGRSLGPGPLDHTGAGDYARCRLWRSQSHFRAGSYEPRYGSINCARGRRGAQWGVDGWA